MATPRDGYERYYVEKLWSWIPEIYRHEDGVALQPDALRSFIELIGPPAAVARRSIDRLWEDQFGDFADDWALPYIGDLVGTRLVSALNRRGRRADVVHTIFYRRRKGTLTVLEQLIHDITGWDGAVIEAFRRLGRVPHRLDAPLAGPGSVRFGAVTVTPPGGFADLRAARGGDLVDGPFDEYSHTADVRQVRGHLGRYNIPKINFHLFRQLAFTFSFVTPFDLGSQRFTFDPSGRDVPLFRSWPRDDDECRPTEEWRITAPIACRLLGAAHYVLERGDIPPGLEPQLSRLLGVLFRDEARLRRILATLLTPAQFNAAIYPILAAAITANSPKRQLYPAAVAVSVGADTDDPALPRERMLAANLADWGATLGIAAGKQLAIDPHRGRFLLTAPPLAGTRVFVPVHQTGLFGPLGASSYDRRNSVVPATVPPFPDGGITEPGPVTSFPMPNIGVKTFLNSKTYQPDSPAGGIVTGVQQLTIQAADGQRPYVRLVPDGGGTSWTFRADPAAPAVLAIDGLWLGLWPSGLAAQAVAGAHVPATPVPVTIVLDGEYELVTIRHCTIDPGGEQARVVPTQVMPVPAVQLEIIGQVETLVIERSIVGPVRESSSTADPCSAGKIVVRDSVVQSILPGVPAIQTRIAALEIERSTVFGDVLVNRLEASETLIQGNVQVIDNQHGCFRFSATNAVPEPQLPRQFESHLLAPTVPNHVFVSRRFGDPGYAQLSETAPATLQRGAENGSEIGVWSRMLTPIKRDDLRAKVGEFMPFGLIAQFIDET